MTGFPGYKREQNTERQTKKKESDFLLLVFIAFSISVVLIGLVIILGLKSAIREESSRDIEAIAKLRNSQILIWRQDRLVEANSIFTNALLLDEFEKWEVSGSKEVENDIRLWLSSMKNNRNFRDVMLLDRECNTVFATASADSPGTESRKQAERSLATRLPSLHVHSHGGAPPQKHIELIVPLFGKAKLHLGYVLIRIDLAQFLNPMLKTWPVGNKSAETILCASSGDSVVFLSDIRFPGQKDTQSSILKNTTRLPAALAVKGASGIVEDVDYRGTPVIAHFSKIDDSDWFLIAKMDTEEIFAPLWAHSFLITAIIFLLILAAGVSLRFYSLKQGRAQAESIEEKAALEKHYETLLTYANDIIILLNSNLEITYANKRASEIYGYSPDEILRLTIFDIRSTDERSKTKLQFKNIDDAERGIYETIHRKKNGSLFPVEVSVHKVYLAGEVHYQGIIRDITDRKNYDRQMMQLNRIYAVLSNVNQAIVRVKSKAELFHEICRIAVMEGKFFAVWIGLPDDTAVSIGDCFGLDREYLDSHIVALIRANFTESLTKEVLNSGKRRVVNKVGEDATSPEWRKLQLDLGINSLSVYPLHMGNQEYAVIYFYCHEEDYFNEQELKLIDRLVQDIEIALASLELDNQRVRAENDARQRSIEMEKLVESTQLINTILDTTSILRSLLLSAVEITAARSGAAGLMQDGEMVFTEFVQNGKILSSPASLMDGTANSGITPAYDAEKTNAPGTEGHNLIVEFSRPGSASSSINVPIENRLGVRIGCFELHNKSGDVPFTETDRILLEGLAAGAAIALNNTQMLEDRTRAETALSISETQMRATLENTPFVAVQWYDTQGKVLYWNAASERIYGWKQEETLGRSLDELILSPEDYKEFLEALRKMSSDKKPYGPFEVKIQRRDGSYGYVLSTAFPIPGASKEDVFVCMDIDITEAKHSEARVKWNEIRSNSLLKIYEFQAESTNHLLKYALEEVVRLTESAVGFIFLFDEIKKEFQLNAYSDAVMAQCTVEERKSCFELNATGLWGEAVRQRKEIIVNNFEMDNPIKKGYPEGHVHIKKFLAVPIFENRRIVAVVGVANKPNDYDHFDIQQTKIVMTAVWKIVQRRIDGDKVRKLSHIVEQSPVSILITNLKGEIEYVNPKFSAVTGYTVAEVAGRNPSFLKSGETNPEVYSEMWSTIIAGNAWRGEFHNRRKNGELFWELASISPVKDEDGTITHFVAVKEDITALKQAELDLINAKNQAEEMNRLKSTFLANMSHELRTPMIGILGYTEVLKEEITDSEQKGMVDVIHSSGNRLLDTLNLILDLSKIEADKLEINTEEVNIIPAIKEVAALFREAALRKNLTLETEFASPEIFCRIDKTIFFQIINNLLNNAIKYTKEGGVFVTAYPDNQENAAIIRVEDTGIGISRENQKLIWDEFRQVSEGMDRQFEGTGLGLSITKKFVEKLGGVISVESELGVGSTFICKLPVSAGSEAKKDVGLQEQLPPTERAENDKRKLLIVEDDRVSVDLIRKFLPSRYVIDSARDGEAALKKVSNAYYDAILMDINLGRGMNGVDVTKKIRLLPAYQAVPIVAVTAYAMVGDKREFLKAGCTHYLSKPFGRKEFVDLIESLFSA